MKVQNWHFYKCWFLAKNLAYAKCRIIKFHYRNSSNIHAISIILVDNNFGLAPFFIWPIWDTYLIFFIGTSSLGYSPCLEENTDYTGNDITPVTQRFTNSWQECGNYLLNSWMPFTKLWITKTFSVFVTLKYLWIYFPRCSMQSVLTMPLLDMERTPAKSRVLVKNIAYWKYVSKWSFQWP